MMNCVGKGWLCTIVKLILLWISLIFQEVSILLCVLILRANFLPQCTGES